MTPPPSPPAGSSSSRAAGLIFGLAAVLCFSLTLPATRLALGSFDPVTVALGRAVIPALLAAGLLGITRQRFPAGKEWAGLAAVAVCLAIGFPALTAWAMRRTDASHGAAILGLVPLATAAAGCFRTGDRPSFAFWAAGIAGAAAVIVFALWTGGGGFRPADLALLGAVLLSAIGYAEGARLSRTLGSWQVICWALVLAFPVLLPALLWNLAQHGLNATPGAWAGVLYLGLISNFLAFFAWYRGLHIGGVARVSQVQLLQPFFTLLFAPFFPGESPAAGPLLCAGAVAASVFISQRARVGAVAVVQAK